MAETLESLTYKTLVLKISIHCKGCMKKINKIIKNTEGVLETTIEPLQKKVTVKATVGADVLIARLAKYHAELWPQPKPSPTKNDNNAKAENKNEKSTETAKPKQPSENSEKKSATPVVPADKQTTDNKKEAAEQKSPAEPAKPANESVEKKVNKEESVEKKVSKEATKPDHDKKAENPPALPEKPAATTTDAASAKTENKPPATNSPSSENTEKNNTTSDKKSKGKKSHEETTDRAIPDHANVREAGSNNMAMQNMFPYPPQVPSYVMSYNMSQPAASQSYYAYPMQPEPQGYMYQQPPQQEYYYGSLEGNSSSGTRHQYSSYDGMNMFNEEDPNSCSVM